MEQMHIDQAAIISLDYERADVPDTVRQFKPVVFTEGDSICCLLGPDPQVGIFGCGLSTQAALLDWNNHLLQEINHPTPDNETTRFVLDHLNRP